MCVLLVFAACQQKKQAASAAFSLIWTAGRATGIAFVKDSLAGMEDAVIHSALEVRLASASKPTAIAGSIVVNAHEVIFEPALPFTRGLRYAVYVQDKFYGDVEIPADSIVPQLLALYPRGDTLPENLLKVHLVFSKPMQEGHVLRYISLLTERGDSLPNTFLDLQSALWNTDGTMLTLWLDPGRIKRDLQPNQLMGAPLVNGNRYQLVISGEWPDKQGNFLARSYTKKFVTAARDTVSPIPAEWKIDLPITGSQQGLTVEIDEQLDYVLLLNAIAVTGPDGAVLQGEIQMGDNEISFHFIPLKPWVKGKYKLQVEPRLSDLAGNTLYRLFDTDLRRPAARQNREDGVELAWEIK